MLESLQNYAQLCNQLGREPNAAEFLAWSYLGVEPEWFKKLKGEEK